MFWGVLKPRLSLADEPSVRRETCPLKVLVQVAIFACSLCCAPLTASAASPAAGAKGTDWTEVAAVEYSVSPSTFLEFANKALKATSATTPEYTIRRTAPEVRVQFSVADERGRPITDLTADDIRIIDDHFAVHRIRQFSRPQDLPLQVGLLLDVSDSVQKSIPHEKKAAQVFFDQVMRPMSDWAFLMGFGRDAQLWQDSTGDIPALDRALQRIQQSGYSTNLYDSIFDACLNFRRTEPGTQTQRVILLFSDGEDTASAHTLGEAIALAQRREIQIYTVAMHPGRRFAAGDAALRQLADETGGHMYVFSRERELQTIFTAMDRQIRTQYNVSFAAERHTPGFHDLRIETTSRGNLHVHARQGYYFDAH